MDQVFFSKSIQLFQTNYTVYQILTTISNLHHVQGIYTLDHNNVIIDLYEDDTLLLQIK